MRFYDQDEGDRCYERGQSHQSRRNVGTNPRPAKRLKLKVKQQTTLIEMFSRNAERITLNPKDAGWSALIPK